MTKGQPPIVNLYEKSIAFSISFTAYTVKVRGSAECEKYYFFLIFLIIHLLDIYSSMPIVYIPVIHSEASLRIFKFLEHVTVVE